MKGFPDLPPIWLMAGLAVAWVLARHLPLVTVAGPLYQGAGWVMIAAGVVLIGWSGLWFWRKRTPIEPHHDPAALIVEGPYAISRNPIYLAMLAILSGYVLTLGALSALAVPVAFHRVLTARFVIPEEAALRRAFGARADRYFTQTRRWL